MSSASDHNSGFDLTSVRNTSGGRVLAPYAENAANTRGRLIAEKTSPTRTDFQRDRDRVIHSDAFRRLKHKTQVFVHHEDDHYRTRLTHTIEVGQIARALARALRVDEDLAECLALVHDFGHTPFGHAGERVLAAKMAEYGGFDHNAQSLRVVTSLERRYAAFDGLNLTWETLEGLAKHNGPLTDSRGIGLDGDLPTAFHEYNMRHDLWLWSWPSVEAQCAAIADDIAYDNHDLDDGLRAGLFTLEELADVALSSKILAEIREQHPKLDDYRTNHEIVRRQVTAMVEDVISQSVRNISQSGVKNADDVRNLDRAVVGFSRQMRTQEKELKTFLFSHMYRHESVMAQVEKAEHLLAQLFDAYFADPGGMPLQGDWVVAGLSGEQRARKIADYIAGMTDRFAISEHQRLFDATPELG